MAGEALQAPCLSALLQLHQDKMSVKGYLRQSLPYLKDSQASLRCEAVKFIGEPNRWVLLWALPWQQGAALQTPEHPAHTSSPDGCLAQVPPRALSLPATREGKQLGWLGCTLCSVGSGGLMGALSLGLAVQYSREQSKEVLDEICSGE